MGGYGDRQAGGAAASLLLAGAYQCGTERMAGLGRASLPSRRLRPLPVFLEAQREVILLQERLPLPLKHCSCGGTDTQSAALVTPRPAGKGHLCSDFTGVMDGASCSQLGQEGEAAGRSSVSLPGAVGSLVPLQQPWAASVIHLGHSSGGAQMPLPRVWWWLG